MADALDKASEYAAAAAAARVSQIRAAASGSDAGGIYCEDCGMEIPEGRRRAVPGCTRCVSCQDAFERMGGDV